MIKAYIILTKPGIIFSNILTAAGGFFLAAKGHITLPLFFAMLFGLALVVASACVFNNYIDRKIDAKMIRTKRRALVTGRISEKAALLYAVLLEIGGFSLLLIYTSVLTTFIAFIGFFFYVVLYSIGKRQSEYGTLIGSVSGAVPPVVGYCAVTNNVDLAAVLLFLILFFWQMPHFYAIAMFRSKEYDAASIPVLPLKKGRQQTKIHMLVYIVAFTIAAMFLTIYRYTGDSYLITIGTLGVLWFGIAFRGVLETDDKKWARLMFVVSLVIIVLFSLLLSFNPLLP